MEIIRFWMKIALWVALSLADFLDFFERICFASRGKDWVCVLEEEEAVKNMIGMVCGDFWVTMGIVLGVYPEARFIAGGDLDKKSATVLFLP